DGAQVREPRRAGDDHGARVREGHRRKAERRARVRPRVRARHRGRGGRDRMKARLRPQRFTRFYTLKTPTAGQNAFNKVAYDGLEPSELEGEEREKALAIFGPIQSVPPAA